MSASVDLRDLERRPVKYWHADGLPELFMGIVWILWGISWLFGQWLPRGTWWNMFWMFTPALLAFSSVASVWATRKLKARVTFPRTGYVAWHEPTRLQRLTTAVVAIVAASVIAALSVTSRVHGVERFAPLALGVVLSLGFVIASLTQHAPHMLALAGVALMLGLAFVGLELGLQSTNWMLIGVGGATAGTGAIRLRLFLKRHPLERRA